MDPIDQARRPSTMAENRRFMNFFSSMYVNLQLILFTEYILHTLPRLSEISEKTWEKIWNFLEEKVSVS